VKEETDDANLLTKQLERKDAAPAAELEDVEGEEARGGRSYLERMGLDERRGEIKAGQKVVRSYLAKANAKRVRLRKRYEELHSERSEISPVPVGLVCLRTVVEEERR